MAVAPTGNIFKALSFDNVSSRTYGVYITGEAVYNAPGRDVEMVEIPGRNGSFALDKGRFQNIEVSYPAGIFADNETDFAEAISDFRNFLCSRNGYVRLTDEYNPNEYRMAIYKSGLEVSPAQLKAGEFTITFDCKPQRWLTSGETAVSVANNGTLTNPTLFEASPLLQFTGYGNIGINGSPITVENKQYGEVLLANKKYWSTGTTSTLDQNKLSLMNTGDAIRVMSGSTVIVYIYGISTITSASRSGGDTEANVSFGKSNYTNYISIELPELAYSKGTQTTHTVNLSVSFTYVASGSTSTWSGTLPITIQYTISSTINRIGFGIGTASPSLPSSASVRIDGDSFVASVYGNSTKIITSDTAYIDLDIGEGYILLNSSPVSINNIITLPAELPTLAKGSTTFTYSNTFSNFKVIPRWWKV